MDGKGVKKLPNGVEKFGVLDHFSADLDGICLGITGVNDPSDSVQMPIGCRNWHNVLSFAAGKNFDRSIWLDRTQRCSVFVTKKDSFERQNLSTCMAHLSVELIPKKFS